MGPIQEQLILPEGLTSRIQSAESFLFDLDDSLVENQGQLDPDLAEQLRASGKACGVATSRAENEMLEILSGSPFSREDVFAAPIVLEDGGVVLMPGASEARLMVEQQVAHAPSRLLVHIGTHLKDIPGEANWKQLADLDAPWVEIPTKYDYRTSATLWEKGPAGSPDFVHVQRWCEAAARELGVDQLIDITEVGNGTLRFTPRGITKGVTLGQLHGEGAIDLSKTVFFCDGANDIAAARAILGHGGTVVCVHQHCSELMDLATFVTPEAFRGPTAISRILQMTAPEA